MDLFEINRLRHASCRFFHARAILIHDTITRLHGEVDDAVLHKLGRQFDALRLRHRLEADGKFARRKQ